MIRLSNRGGLSECPLCMYVLSVKVPLSAVHLSALDTRIAPFSVVLAKINCYVIRNLVIWTMTQKRRVLWDSDHIQYSKQSAHILVE